MNWTEKIQAADQDLINKLALVKNLEQLELVKVEFVGRKGLMSQWMEDLAKLPLEDKRQFGPIFNQAKQRWQQAILDVQQHLLDTSNKNVQAFDVTAYQPQVAHPGNLHLYSKFMDEIRDIFLSMGFRVFDGPEVETDFYNFTALNIPSDHPARDMFDTLWLDVPDHLMRTHTSPIQIRSMLKYGAPLAGIAMGEVFRHEAVDATHEVAFHQLEGICIDKNVTMEELKGALEHFAKELFGKATKIRMRSSFFPFTEPSVEVDCTCVFCAGKGCKVCKQSGWIEILGAGMVHPNVLEQVGYPSNELTGFAFGLGIERIAMLLYGIDDIRHFYENDIRFLEQFV